MLSSDNPLGKNDPYSLFENQIEKLGAFAKLRVRENDRPNPRRKPGDREGYERAEGDGIWSLVGC